MMKIFKLPIFIFSTLLIAACADKGGSDNNSKPESVTKARSANDVPLTTEIPPENTQGTPMPIKVPNLEPAQSGPPVMMVPEKVDLLSANKPVTSSDDFPIVGDLSYITDGDKEAGEGYFVELMSGLQWVQIDLAEPARISAIWIWHYHWELRAYHDVIVQLSNDPEFKSGVSTVYNNDYDNSAQKGKGTDKPYVENRFGKLVDAQGIEARYVRLYSQGNTSTDMNHYIEVEVFGIRK